jgi:hypothetical protein
MKTAIATTRISLEDLSRNHISPQHRDTIMNAIALI